MNDPTKIEIADVRAQLEKLELSFAVAALGSELAAAGKEKRPAHEVLYRLLQREIDQREERRVARSLRLSGLPPGMTLADFDFGFQPGIDKAQIETLGSCAFIQEAANVILLGPPGVGKTHLAVALGVRAVQHGYGTAYFRLDELLGEMRKDADTPLSRLRRKKYLKAAYLIIDEVGFEPMTATDAALFFRLISYRYSRGATAITSNKSIKDWPGIFADDQALTSAILDRLLHKSTVLNIRGRSYRVQDLERLLK